MELDEWDRVLDIDLDGVMHGTKAALPHLLDTEGFIVNVASIYGLVGGKGAASYSAAKGGVIAFTQALAKETASKGVRVNCVSPGPTQSEAGRNIPTEVKKNFAYQALSQSTGFGRFAEPDDIANLAVFLASDDAKFITGQNHPVCGVMNLGLNESLIG